MKKKLALLIVEDSEADAELAVHAVRGGGFDLVYERVSTPQGMSSALDKRLWDVVVSDYSMPGFSGAAALAMLKERNVDIPFISVSGTMGEEVAVAMMKAGAHDYVIKGDFRRLVPAIERELRASDARREQKAIQEAAFHLAAIVECSEDAIVSQNLEGIVVSWNRAAEKIYGYSTNEMIGKPSVILVPPSRPDELPEILNRFLTTGTVDRIETIRMRKGGQHFPVALTISPVKDSSDRVIGISMIARDITDRRREEEERMQLIEELMTTLQQIKTLRGLLPICSCCKKIRDDHGYWQAVEVFIRDHSNAEFSHSICPECVKREYPEYAADLKSQT